MPTDPKEPTPAEEAAAREKETAEQAAMPYKWTQTIADLDVSFEVPGNLKSRDLVVQISKQKLVAGVKGQDPIISVCPITSTSHCNYTYAMTYRQVDFVCVIDICDVG